MRKLAWVVFAIGCGGGTKHAATPVAPPGTAPIVAASPSPPPPPPDQQTVAIADPSSGNGADPCDGGEVTGGADGDGDGFGKGGLGLVGTGRGGGGGGEGIGLGHGSSIGSAGPGARQPRPITAREGKVTVKGSLPVDVVRRIVRRNQAQLRYCYEQQLASHPALQGTLMLTLAIDRSGVVASAQAHGIHADLEACAVRAATRWEFPRPPKADVVIATVPYVFAPGE